MAIDDSIMDLTPTAGCAGVTGGRVPGGVVGIKIPQDQSVLWGVEKGIKARVVVWRAGGGRGDIYIVDC